MSIILMLAGLLLPALSHARSVARGAPCASNQHQIGVGTSLFSGDWSDLVPREGISPWRSIPALGRHIPWLNAVRPYLAGQKNIADIWSPIFRDPAHPNPNHRVHYVVNGIAFEATRGASVGRADRRGATYSSWWHRPGDTIYLTAFTDDRDNSIARKVGVWRLYQAAGVYDIWTPDHLWGPDTNSNGSATDVRRVGINRHENHNNVLFADLHVSQLNADEVLSRERWFDGQYLKANEP